MKNNIETMRSVFHDGHSVTDRRGVIVSVKKRFISGSN